MRLCVIGNSHLAAVKMGWDAIGGDWPSISPVFFGSPGVQIKSLTPRDGRLIAGNERLHEMMLLTSGGLAEIDPEAYNAFVLVGATFGIHPLLRQHQSYRADSHADAGGKPHRVSDALFDKAARGLLETSLALRVLTQVRRVTDKPVWLVPQPAPSAAIMEGPKGDRWRTVVESGDHLKLLDLYRSLSADLAGSGLTILEQPAETLQDLVYSRSEYARGAVALQDESHVLPADDHLHMNATYGEIVLRDLLGRLG